MDNPQPSMRICEALSGFRLSSIVRYLLLALALGITSHATAQNPDLTNGEVRTDDRTWNLGPTGMSGWLYRPDWTSKHNGWNSEFARQIEVITVDAGSPADGILQIGDVILGADGTGIDPVNFTSDARKAFADAISDAEANSPAILKLLVWRAGTTSIMSLTLETLGAYSATAPYNCPKSAAVLEKGLDAVMAQGGTDVWNFSLLALLAGNDPSNPDNAARMARAQQEAHNLILTPEAIDTYTSPVPLTTSKIAWALGFKLVALAEYYLQTGDAAVYDSLRAYAIAYANGQSMFGTGGHQFSKMGADGSINGPYGIGYGVVSSANMQCFYGLILAREAGVTDQRVLDAIERASNFYGAYVDRGSIPYGEHEPMMYYGENGKNGIAALCFKAEGTRNDDANYYAVLAGSTAHNLDDGHQGPYFNYLWAPLGANAGGEASMAQFFAEQRWRFELARNWDGTFTYNTYNNGGQGGSGNKTWSSPKLEMYVAALLPYATPLRQTYSTGKNITDDPSKWLSSADLDDIAISSGYDATSRSTNELMGDLDNGSPITRKAAAVEIGIRTSEHASLLPTLHAMATDSNASLQSRMGACRALGAIRDGSSVSLLVGLLTDSKSRVKWAAATALGEFLPEVLLPEIDAIMTATIVEGKPTLPLDPEDPIHLTHMEIVELLTFKMLRNHDLVGINRDLLIPAIRASATHPTGTIRSDAGGLYSKLSREEVEELADILVDGTLYEAPADRMFSVSGRMAGLNAMQAHNFSEGVPMAMILTEELNSIPALNTLIAYGANSLLVEPDHEVLKWLDVLEASDSDLSFINASNWPDPGTHNHIDWVRDAINSDPGPYEKPEALKRIYSVVADDATLALPDSLTGLHVEAYDYAQLGDTVYAYTWRKVHGAGEVSFYPNGTTAAKDTTVVFDGIPGEYLFEVKMSDSLGFSEVTQTVAVTLEKVGGGLDPNAAPTADDQSVTVSDGTPTSIILTGSDPEGFLLNYTVTSGPSHGTLSGTAPNLVYTASAGYTGSDSISFEVMDSEGQVHSGTVSITVGAAAPVGLAIYEPFEGYPQNPTDINGFAGTSEIGFAAGSTWTSGADIYADDTAPIGFPAGGYTYGPLPTTGSKLWLQGMNAPGLSRPIHPDALTNSGLLADGATLWFSALIGADDTHLRNVQIALANASFATSTINIQDDGADPGTGLGFELSSTDGQFNAVQFFDTTQGGVLRGDFDITAAGRFVRNGDLRLVVGKISWGAASDIVELYLPLLPDAGASIVLPDKPSSTLVANVEQSKFDVLAVSRGSNLWVDEIRVGATLQSVLMGTVDAGGIANDGAAPAPNPMTFALAPFVSGQDSITMTATPAFDPLGVEYYFTCTAGAGGSDSGWQDSHVYTDTGLTPGIAYSYTVKARDKTPGLNETAASSVATAMIPSLGTVPDLVGVVQASAEAMITDAGMAVGSITAASSYSLTVPAGHVLTQTPTASSSAAYGSAVNLEISIGQDPALPTLASVGIVDNQGGMHVTLPATIIYTLTFSQDMDVTTIDAGDFVNLAGSPLIIGAINEISPRVVTVEVTPNTIESGYLRLAIAQGAVIKDAQGNNLNTTSAIADEDWIPLLRPDNYVPFVDAGADQTVSMDSPQPWSPYLMNAAAWYDAADAATIGQTGGTVYQWDDKSGNGNHASQGNTSTQPSYNSSDPNLNNLPSIGYDQAFKTLLTNSFAAQRAYVVTYYDQAIFGNWHAAILGRNTGSRFLSGSSGQNYLNSGHANTGTAYQNGDRSANLLDGSNPAVLPMSASVWTVTVNTPTLDQWVLLGGTQSYSGWENGALGEVILTDGNESLETQQKIEGYLAHKWGLEASLAADHPYKLEAPTSPAALAVLDATVNDNDNDPLTTLWTMVSGPAGVAFGPSSAVDTTATFLEAGTYILQLSADDGTAQASDQVTITVEGGTDITPPTLSGADIVDDQGGADVFENTLVTYTVTFSEDMSAATVQASDFGNAGTAPVSIGTIAETSPGMFSVGVTPTATGTLQLQVNAGATLNDISGNPLDTSSAIVDDTTINVAPPNNVPVFTANPFSASDATQDSAYTASIAGAATDVDGDTLTYTVVTAPANGMLSGTAPDLTYTPNTGYSGSDSFTFVANDGTVDSNTATVSVTTNNAPVVDAGLDQTVTLSAGGGAWTPLTLNPGLWLDASDDTTVTLNGATVSQWADKSTFNRHATASDTAQPTATAAGLNGKRVLTFDGSTDVLNVDLDFLAGVSHSAFIVTKPTIFSNIYGAANASSGGNSLHVGFNGSNYRMNFWSNDFGPVRSANFVAGSANIVNYIWTTGTGKQILANGKSEGTNTNAGVIGTMSGGGRIGRTTGHPFFGGDIAEIIIIPGAVTAQSRQEIEGYLAHKWGLQANLPADHPYKSVAPGEGSSAQATLNGTISDPDGDPLTSNWSVVSGPGTVGFADASAVDTTATFTASGTYVLELTADDSRHQTSDQVTITVQSPFEDWAGEGSSPVEDSNGDGISNGLAWVLGASDSSSDASALLPTGDSESDPEYYIFTFRRADIAHNDTNTSISVIYGEDLSAWSTAVHDGLNVIITEADDGYANGVDRVEVKISWDLVSGNKIFARLRVEITQ